MSKSKAVSTGGNKRKKPENWPEGLWFSAADNNLFKVAVHLSNIEPAYRNYNDNAELQAQVELRDEHADIINPTAASGGAAAAKPSGSSEIVYAFINAANAEIQKQRRFLDVNCNKDDKQYRQVEDAQELAKAFDCFSKAIVPGADGEDDEKAYKASLLAAAMEFAKAMLECREEMSYVQGKLNRAYTDREKNAAKAKSAKATPKKEVEAETSP